MKCPCKECEKAGCGQYHDQCERYQAWIASRHEIKRMKWLEQDSRQLSHDHEMKYRKNLKRKKGA